VWVFRWIFRRKRRWYVVVALVVLGLALLYLKWAATMRVHANDPAIENYSDSDWSHTGRSALEIPTLTEIRELFREERLRTGLQILSPDVGARSLGAFVHQPNFDGRLSKRRLSPAEQVRADQQAERNRCLAQQRRRDREQTARLARQRQSTPPKPPIVDLAVQLLSNVELRQMRRVLLWLAAPGVTLTESEERLKNEWFHPCLRECARRQISESFDAKSDQTNEPPWHPDALSSGC